MFKAAVAITLVAATLAMAIPPQAPPQKQAPVIPPDFKDVYDPEIPKAATRYSSAKWTQAISVLFTGGSDIDIIKPVKIAEMEDKRWHQAGGMQGIKGWSAERYRLVPAAVTYRVEDIEIDNSIPTGVTKPDGTPETFRQKNRGITLVYPNGTRFDELLYNGKKLFEHRTREKIDGKWESKVAYKDEDARPEGYTGLKVNCSSCHSEAGTGKYNDGLVPGGDTVLSDPLDWSVSGQKSPE